MELSETQFQLLRTRFSEEKARDIQDALSESEHPVVIDTNILVEIAKLGEEGYKILKGLSASRNVILTDEVIQEIDGLVWSKRFGGKITTYLGNFIKLYKNRAKGLIKKAGSIVRKIKKDLEPFIELLPRSIVIDVMIRLPDSFYNKISKNLRDEVLFDNEKMQIIAKIGKRFNELTAKYGISDKLTNPQKVRFFSDAEQVKNDILAIIEGLKTQPQNLKTTLEKYARKSFDNDVAIVAEAVAKGIEVETVDQDVRWLEQFYRVKYA